MSFDFTKSAQAAVSNSFVREGREKITIDELAEHYPNGITITEFDMLSSKDGTFPTFAYAEDINFYFNGNMSLRAIVDKWLEGFNGSVEDCSNALKASGGVRIKFLPKQRTSNGFWFTPVEVIVK